MKMTGGSNIEFHLTHAGGTVVLHVRGEVDLWNVVLLQEAVKTASETAPEVVVDLAEVGFIDLRGLEAGLVEPARVAGSRGRAVAIRNEPRTVTRLFELTDLDLAFATVGGNENNSD
jgi:anti-anti-sigma factor